MVETTLPISSETVAATTSLVGTAVVFLSMPSAVIIGPITDYAAVPNRHTEKSAGHSISLYS